MPISLTDEQILSFMDVDDFIRSCDEAFRLYGEGELVNLPRQESLTRSVGMDVFRLELAGVWAGKLKGYKVIVERSDVATGRLGERSATIELTMEDSDTSIRLDAESITNWRTGAAAALGAKYLAPTNSPIVAILGTGRIAESTAVAVDRVLTPDVIRVTSRSAEKRDAFRARVAPRVQARLETVLTVEDAVSEADTVITAVPTPKPILSNAMLKSGAHLSVVAGDPRTVQLEEDILRERPLVVDHPDQARASGDFVRYVDRVSKFRTLNVDGRQATIGDAATGRLESHRGAGCVTYFTGMAIQDLHAAFVVLSKAGLVRELHV